MKVKGVKGKSWLLTLSSTFSEEHVVSALQKSVQKGFTNCRLFIAKNSQPDTGKAAILHLQKSILKGQVDGLFNSESKRMNGNIVHIKSKLKINGYSLFHSLQIPGSGRSQATKKRVKRDSRSYQNTEPFAKSDTYCGRDIGQELAKYSTLQDELLEFLKSEAGLDVSGCTELSQTMQIVREMIKTLMSESKILFTNIEDLEDDHKQDKSRIEALQKKLSILRRAYETKLRFEEERYEELKIQFENLRSRFRHIERRESETLLESHRRLEEWMSSFVDHHAQINDGACALLVSSITCIEKMRRRSPGHLDQEFVPLRRHFRHCAQTGLNGEGVILTGISWRRIDANIILIGDDDCVIFQDA